MGGREADTEDEDLGQRHTAGTTVYTKHHSQILPGTPHSAQLPKDTEDLVTQRNTTWQRKERSAFSTFHKETLGAGTRGCKEEGEAALINRAKAISCFPSPGKGLSTENVVASNN